MRRRIKRKPRGEKDKAAICLFCKADVPRPATFDVEGVSSETKGGWCSCGVLFLMDEIGKGGGLVVLDGLLLLSDGDFDRSLELVENTDYEIKRKGYNPRLHRLEPRLRGRGGLGQPKLWYFRRLERPA